MTDAEPRAWRRSSNAALNRDRRVVSPAKLLAATYSVATPEHVCSKRPEWPMPFNISNLARSTAGLRAPVMAGVRGAK